MGTANIGENGSTVRLATDLTDGSAVPYFLWDEPLTVDELRRRLVARTTTKSPSVWLPEGLEMPVSAAQLQSFIDDSRKRYVSRIDTGGHG